MSNTKLKPIVALMFVLFSSLSHAFYACEVKLSLKSDMGSRSVAHEVYRINDGVKGNNGIDGLAFYQESPTSYISHTFSMDGDEQTATFNLMRRTKLEYASSYEDIEVIQLKGEDKHEIIFDVYKLKIICSEDDRESDEVEYFSANDFDLMTSLLYGEYEANYNKVTKYKGKTAQKKKCRVAIDRTNEQNGQVNISIINNEEVSNISLLRKGALYESPLILSSMLYVNRPDEGLVKLLVVEQVKNKKVFSIKVKSKGLSKTVSCAIKV